MAFSRAVPRATAPDPAALNAAMAGIGMNFAVPTVDDQANIEDTLFFASMTAMQDDDLRVLAVLVTWFGVHAPRVNVDRLTNLVTRELPHRLRALWSALARWRAKDRRFARLGAFYEGPRVDLLTSGSDFQVRRHGEDSRFAGSCLRVPANVLRDRGADVLAPAELAQRHRAYRRRIMIGPSYRADMWAALETQPELTATALAQKTYGSFATAWGVRQDFDLLAQHPWHDVTPLRSGRRRVKEKIGSSPRS
jgi:hypothetical protein